MTLFCNIDSRNKRPPRWRAWASAAIGAAAALALGVGAHAAPMSYAEKLDYLKTHPLPARAIQPMFLDAPPRAAETAAARMDKLRAAGIAPVGLGVTVPHWSTQIKSPVDGLPYNISMVGSSPYATTPANTHVEYVPIILRVVIGHFLFDPTVNGNCDSLSPASRFFNSPLFTPNSFSSNGVDVTAPGGSQLISAFQRANFWSAVKGTNYGVTLVASRPTPVVVTYVADTATYADDAVFGIPNQCGKGYNPFGIIDINEYDALMQTLAVKYAAANEIPVVLNYNVVLDSGYTHNCCIIGYHNAIPVANGTQVYAVGSYIDPGVFVDGTGATVISDTSAWSHEMGELIDDPFVQSLPGAAGGVKNDATPSWGNLGQVGGCQKNLEVGDPLTGSYYAVTGAAGFVYHYQDLVFHDWFYRTASTSAGGSGSFKGLLAAGGQPAVCTYH